MLFIFVSTKTELEKKTVKHLTARIKLLMFLPLFTRMTGPQWRFTTTKCGLLVAAIQTNSTTATTALSTTRKMNTIGKSVRRILDQKYSQVSFSAMLKVFILSADEEIIMNEPCIAWETGAGASSARWRILTSMLRSIFIRITQAGKLSAIMLILVKSESEISPYLGKN